MIGKTYPLQVSLHHVNAMHVLQPSRGVGQLNKSVVSGVYARYSPITHELDTINPSMFPNILADVTVIHPLRHHRKLASFQIHTNKW